MTFRDIGAQSTVRNCSSNMSEIICIQWSDFQENIKNAFGNLRKNNDFTDVTLVCEDGQQVKAHKVILAVSSLFFQKLLRGNKHPHPLIYMRGMTFEDLMAIVDFCYYGEAKVFQENLDSFLTIAEELQLKAWTRKTNEKVEDCEEEEGILIPTISPQSVNTPGVARRPAHKNRNSRNLGKNRTLAAPRLNSGNFGEPNKGMRPGSNDEVKKEGGKRLMEELERAYTEKEAEVAKITKQLLESTKDD